MNNVVKNKHKEIDSFNKRFFLFFTWYLNKSYAGSTI